MRVSLTEFPPSLRPAIRVFLGPPRPDAWRRALEVVGVRNERALAKAMIGRRRPPFFDVNLFLAPAARALAREPEWLAKAAEDFVAQLAALGGARMGDAERVAEARKLIPSSVLSDDARASMRELAGNPRYRQIASALRGWAGRGKFSPPKPANGAMGRLELLADALVTAKTAKEASARADAIEELGWEDAADEDPRRLATIVRRVRAALHEASGVRERELQRVLDALCST